MACTATLTGSTIAPCSKLKLSGQLHDLARRRHPQLLRAAGRLKALHTQHVADVLVTAQAGRAAAAHDLRQGGDLVAGREPADVRTYGFDQRRELVTLDHRIARVRVFAVKDVDVGAAHADALNAQQHLAGPGRGNWRLA